MVNVCIDVEFEEYILGTKEKNKRKCAIFMIPVNVKHWPRRTTTTTTKSRLANEERRKNERRKTEEKER